MAFEKLRVHAVDAKDDDALADIARDGAAAVDLDEQREKADGGGVPGEPAPPVPNRFVVDAHLRSARARHAVPLRFLCGRE